MQLTAYLNPQCRVSESTANLSRLKKVFKDAKIKQFPYIESDSPIHNTHKIIREIHIDLSGFSDPREVAKIVGRVRLFLDNILIIWCIEQDILAKAEAILDGSEFNIETRNDENAMFEDFKLFINGTEAHQNKGKFVTIIQELHITSLQELIDVLLDTNRFMNLLSICGIGGIFIGTLINQIIEFLQNKSIRLKVNVNFVAYPNAETGSYEYQKIRASGSYRQKLINFISNS